MDFVAQNEENEFFSNETFKMSLDAENYSFTPHSIQRLINNY